MPTVAPRRTKIVATIGPACSTPETLRALVDAGMDAARLNLSHGTHEDHAARAQLVRDVQEDVGRPLALIGDLQGPKFRVGGLDQPLVLCRRAMRSRSSLGDGAARNGELPVAPGRDRRGAQAGTRGADRRRDDSPARRRGRGRSCALRHRRRRRRHVAQGREPSRRPDPDSVADAEGHSRTCEFALELGVRLHRAVLRALRRRRPRSAEP